MAPTGEYVLSLRCEDRPGIIAAVSTCLFEQGCDIRDAAQFGDEETRGFFVRIHLQSPAGLSEAALREALRPVASGLQLDWRLHALARPLRTLIAVSQQGHCLNDLLHRWHGGLLPTEIVGVVSNHPDMRRLTQWYGLPYHYLPVTAATRAEQEARLAQLLADEQVDLLVLARYMQILSPDLCAQLEGRCINIHHSFLPGFKGARPYHRAHARGVKLIGATAHYATADLDEGPIIEQDVARVTHATCATEMVHQGREIEARVLARAVRWHVEHRVMINGLKTIVFA